MVLYRIFIVLALMFALSHCDWQSDKFTKCCQKENLTCSEVCTYPPPSWNPSQTACVTTNIYTYVNCYTAGNDNQDCCEKAGATGFIYGICKDFCDGKNPPKHWEYRYFVCTFLNDAISKCNHDALKPPPSMLLSTKHAEIEEY